MTPRVPALALLLLAAAVAAQLPPLDLLSASGEFIGVCCCETFGICHVTFY